MKLHKFVTPLLVGAFLLSTAWIPVAAAPTASGGTTRLIPSGGTTSPQTGGFTQPLSAALLARRQPVLG
jgi:hypothetical protein